jgi:basic amino acid/polyamine antiporter, APA family
VNAFGLAPGKWTQNALSAVKLAAFAGLLGLGLIAGRAGTGGLTPLFVPGDRAAGAAAALVPVFFAYSGWNAATYVSGEMRDPVRGLGRALALGTALCIALYLAVNATFLHALPLARLAQSGAPARDAAVVLGGARAAGVLAPLVAVCILSSMQASVLVGPRIYAAMAGDGLFFAPLGRLHPRSRVPVVALAAQAVVSGVELALGKHFETLLTFATSAIVTFATLTVAAVIVLRVRRPDAPRAFRVPGYPVVPAFFVLVNAWVLWCVRGTSAAVVALAIVATGVPAYIAFRARGRGRETPG